jgi:hypothetical protein
MIHGAMLYFSEKARNTRMPKTTTRQDKTRQDKTRQDKTTSPSDTEETKTNTRKKARMEGGRNLFENRREKHPVQKSIGFGHFKKVQRKCPMLFFIPNVLFLEFIMTHLLSLYI